MCALSGLGAQGTEIVHTEYKMPVTYNKGRRPVVLTGITILSSAVSKFDIMTDDGVGGDNF
jgi:hypothetical protein